MSSGTGSGARVILSLKGLGKALVGINSVCVLPRIAFSNG